MLRKDIVMIVGIGIPVGIFMILIGGGGHSDFELSADKISYRKNTGETEEYAMQNMANVNKFEL